LSAGVRNARIFAFEPGPHQCSLFRATIRQNGLEDNIDLLQIALCETNGPERFSIHETKDTSGDGFFDTGRAENTESIDVQVRTIDCWWIEAGRPKIHLVKVATEGTELMVLRGGEAMITSCQPQLFLEINMTNLQRYQYDAPDILDWLLHHNYGLETLEGEAVDTANLLECLAETENFVALPLRQ